MRKVRQTAAAKLNVNRLASAVAIAMLGLSVSAQAQEAAASADNTKLETVTVTANKRAQNQQDVPAAITVFSSAALTRANVRDLKDLSTISPAVTMTSGSQPGNFSINMRGIGTFSLGIGVESDVSVIVDDIPIGMQAGSFKDLADVFRVEVLKGPQSTLFGKSSIAGALNITTKPISGPMKGSLSMLLTNDSEWRLGATMSGAVTDTFRMRLAASKTSYDGEIKNLTTGQNVNGSKGDTVLGKFEWTPITNLDVTLSPHYNYTEMFCCSTATTSLTPGGLYRNVPQLTEAAAYNGITIDKNNVSIRNDYPTGGVFHDLGAGLKLNYLFDKGSMLAGHNLTWISSYDKYHMSDYQDTDNTDLDVLQYLRSPNGTPTGMHGGLYQWGTFDVKSTTEEIRFTSPDSGAFKYLAGLWYGKNELARQLIKVPPVINLGAATSTYNARDLAVGPTCTGSVACGYGTAYGATALNINKAIFAQTSWEFLPATDLITGLRYNREDTGYSFSRLTVPTGPNLPIATTEFYSKTDSHSSVTGRLGLDHKLNKDTMIYGTASTGHKGVAYDLTSGFTATLAAVQPIAAETARSFELGTKMSLMGNRAMINADVFRTNFKNFQQSSSTIDADGQFRTHLNSIGGMKTQGVEIDGNLRATSQLLLNANFAYTQATMTDFPNGPGYRVVNSAGTIVPCAACYFALDAKGVATTSLVQNLNGQTLPNSPKYKVNFGGQYDIPLASESFNAFVTGAYRWQSKTQFSLNQDPATIQSAYSIVNVSGGVKDKKGDITVSLFVNNLFNKSYAANLTSSSGSLPDGTWSAKAPNPVVNVTQNYAWQPARDFQRYFGVRLDVNF